MGQYVTQFGIELKFVPGSKISNTLTAHRLLHYTLQRHGSSLQNAVQEALFEGYFLNGKDIGDPVTLEALAQAAGVKDDGLLAYLNSTEDVELIQQQDREAKTYASGVPFFMFEGREEGLAGAQAPEVFQKIFEEILSTK
eukprot:NODE_4034_length_853_cov_10.468320_g3877_i0.p1 GENE.NODE_4034_length_853_cov_10.468320_g3877_i0~~NODE_4034_length_853_cov_10.468320_g3877_i0.p1  ORF type:complete len:140 (+),score=48.90 NODE_4034_length_853_cov_10.468320_g3877_i0:186-605(+)